MGGSETLPSADRRGELLPSKNAGRDRRRGPPDRDRDRQLVVRHPEHVRFHGSSRGLPRPRRGRRGRVRGIAGRRETSVFRSGVRQPQRGSREHADRRQNRATIPAPRRRDRQHDAAVRADRDGHRLRLGTRSRCLRPGQRFIVGRVRFGRQRGHHQRKAGDRRRGEGGPISHREPGHSPRSRAGVPHREGNRPGRRARGMERRGESVRAVGHDSVRAGRDRPDQHDHRGERWRPEGRLPSLR